MQDRTRQSSSKIAPKLDLGGQRCRAATNIYNTIPTETISRLVPSRYSLRPSLVTQLPIIYLHGVICDSVSIGAVTRKPGAFAIVATAVEPADITPGTPRNLYIIYAVTSIGELQAAFRDAGIDSDETTDFAMLLPSAMQTVLNVGGSSSPFTLTIDAEKPTVPQPFGSNSFNFIGLSDHRQTVFHFDHIESEPGYRGSGAFMGTEGTLLHKLLAGPPTYTALSVPMDFKGSITQRHL
jgi:hypothetical protein